MAKIRPLPPLLADIARRELNEDPDQNEEDIRILKEWIQKQPHLNVRMNDQFLLSFIRASKHSMERTKKKIDLFYTIRTALPEIFKDRQPDNPRVTELIKLGVFMFLPKPLNEAGPRICLIRPGVSNPEKHTIYDSVLPGTLGHELSIVNDDQIVVAGIMEIVDLANVTMAHFFQMDVAFMKKVALLGGEGSSLRHKGTHFINTPSSFETLFNIFKGFLSEKQKSRLHVHGTNLESLYQYIPQKFLPKEYGGENGSIEENVNRLHKQIIEHHDYLLEENNYGVKEELRPVNSGSSAESLFGVDGTFRQLNVD